MREQQSVKSCCSKWTDSLQAAYIDGNGLVRVLCALCSPVVRVYEHGASAAGGQAGAVSLLLPGRSVVVQEGQRADCLKSDLAQLIESQKLNTL